MKIRHTRTGAEVDVTEATAERRISSGRWQAAGRKVTAPAPSPPTSSDTKATWVDFAVSQGADRDEAEALTKADLVELYGS